MAITVTIGSDSGTLSPEQPRLLLGRSDECDLVSAIPGISRRHCELVLEGNNVTIRDLGSANGTWVDGEYAANATNINPGSQVFVGQSAMVVEWTGGANDGATMMVTDMPALIAKAMAARKAQFAAQAPGSMVHVQAPGGSPGTMVPAPAPIAGSPAAAGQGAGWAPNPAEFPYRKQGSNNNGVILVAMRRDTFSNGEVLDGYLEFTATDNETVASITCELVEVHKKGSRKGHVWDRVIARQGPWKAKTGDVLPMPFQMRTPTGTSMSSRDCHWEVRAYVDIEWAYDIKCDCPISMRNVDIEKLRDSLGALDYRLNDISSDPHGQRYAGTFQPPANLIKQIGINEIAMEVLYLGTNLKVSMNIERKGIFKFDRSSEFIIEIDRLRNYTPQQVSSYFNNAITEMMSQK